MLVQKRRLPIGSILTSLLVISMGVAVYLNKTDLVDWWVLRSYQPPQVIANLAAQTSMNSTGKRLFYLHKPLLQDKASFNNSCRENEQTIVLGCYVQRRGIFLLDVEDPRLDGVEQVTSAHEMLHAAYERLSDKERVRIGVLLQQAYSAIDDQRITSNIKAYQAANADVTNELHSILGTEVSKLPPELETYYRKYFVDRSKIVAFSEKYEAEFTSRKAKIESDDAKLTNLESEITANNTKLDQLQTELAAQKGRLTTLRNNGDFAAYNAGVAPYNQAVKQYNSLISQTNALIGQYRAILDERNSYAQDLQTLSKALDSRITTRDQL